MKIPNSHTILPSTNVSSQEEMLRYFWLWARTADIGKLKLPRTITTRQSSSLFAVKFALHKGLLNWKRPWTVSTNDGRLIYESQVAICPCLFTLNCNKFSNANRTHWQRLTISDITKRRLRNISLKDHEIFKNSIYYFGHVIRPGILEVLIRTIDDKHGLQHPTMMTKPWSLLG